MENEGMGIKRSREGLGWWWRCGKCGGVAEKRKAVKDGNDWWGDAWGYCQECEDDTAGMDVDVPGDYLVVSE
jgi:hypothetical protein